MLLLQLLSVSYCLKFAINTMISAEDFIMLLFNVLVNTINIKISNRTYRKE